MNTKTLEALHGSITKWQAIVDGTGIDEGPHNCPLCQLFYWSTRCTGCPVKARTSVDTCAKTPYVEYADDKSIENAQAELDFLKSLVPK